MTLAANINQEALKLFEQVPDLYLILSPDLHILAASDKYLAATNTTRANITGKLILDLVRDNPAVPFAKDVQNLQASLQQVLQTRKPHRMDMQQFDVPDPAQERAFLVKYWVPCNTPVLDDQGEVQYIIHKVEDHTAQKVKEEALLEEQLHLKDAQAVGHIGSFERVLPSTTIFWSDEMYRLHGLEPQSEDITMDKFVGFVHPDDYQKTVAAIEQTHTTGEPLDLIQRIIRADGEVRYVHRRAMVLRNKAGKAYKVYGTIQDITQQVEAQELLKKNQELLWATLDSSRDMIIAFEAVRDADNRITDFTCTLSNHALESLYGQVTGKRLKQIKDSYFDADTFRKYVEVVKTGLPQQYEQCYSSGQQKYWLHHSVVKLDDGVAVTSVDISARKQAEQELLQVNKELAQRATDKYLGLFNNMDQGFCIIEVLFTEEGQPFDCRFLEINPVFEKQTGLANAAGKTVRELGADLEDSWYQYYGSVAKTGKPIHFENEAADLINGTWYEVNAFRVGNPEDHQVAVLFNDVTERKQAELQLRDFNEMLEQQVNERTIALKESEELLNSVLENTISSIMALRAIRNQKGELLDFEYLYVNSNMLKTVPAGSLVGKRLRDNYPGVLPQELYTYFEEVVTTGSSWNGEVHAEYGGDVVWSQVSASKVADGLLVTYFDITERKNAEQELLDTQLLTAQVMDATPDYIMVFNLEQNKIEYVNRHAYKENEDRYQETLSMGYEQILNRAHPDDRESLYAFVNRFRTAPDHETHSIDYRVIDGDAVIWYRSRGKVFKRNEAGKPTHYISVVQDISEIKQLEQENLQIKLDQQKSTMIAILEAQEEERRRISESLHNGVGQLLYAAQLNLERVFSNTDKQKNEALKSVQELLSEAVKQTRQVSHELVPALLQEFGLEQSLFDLCAVYESSAIFLNCVVKGVDSRLDPHLEVAVYRITQELVNNIVKHSGATAATIQLSRDKQNGLLLQVRDNGRGMQPGSTSRKGGIGLKTIEDRVKLLNGTMTITTPKTGKGTQVSIMLPIS